MSKEHGINNGINKKHGIKERNEINNMYERTDADFPFLNKI